MEKFIELHELVKKNPKLQAMKKLLLKTSEKYAQRSPIEFTNSAQHKFLVSELNKLTILGLREISQQLPKFSETIAFIITSNQHFTLAFIMMPKGFGFKWHDHPHMNGFIKCAFGKIVIKSIKLQHLQKAQNQLIYPKSQIRTEYLQPQIQKSLSIIDPHTLTFIQLLLRNNQGFLIFSCQIIQKIFARVFKQKIPMQGRMENIFKLKDCLKLILKKFFPQKNIQMTISESYRDCIIDFIHPQIY